MGDLVYAERKWSGLSSEVKELVHLITLSDSTRPVGSFKYKTHKYPADIDIFEDKQKTFNSIDWTDVKDILYHEITPCKVFLYQCPILGFF